MRVMIYSIYSICNIKMLLSCTHTHIYNISYPALAVYKAPCCWACETLPVTRRGRHHHRAHFPGEETQSPELRKDAEPPPDTQACTRTLPRRPGRLRQHRHLTMTGPSPLPSTARLAQSLTKTTGSCHFLSEQKSTPQKSTRNVSSGM